MKLYIQPNPNRDLNFETALRAAAICADAGAEVWLPTCVPVPERSGVYQADTASLEQIRPDVLIALGGDGTMLRAAHEASPLGIPMMGVNLGNVGFLTELDRTAVEELQSVAEGRFTIEERLMLRCRLYRDGECIYEASALNDCIIARGEMFRNISLRLSSDGTEIKTFSGDGMILATPTGSTAYSLSAGGPVVDPAGSVFVATPICAHALYAKSFVLSSDRTVRVDALRADGKAVRLSCDGVDSIPVYAGDFALITRSPLTTRLVKLHGNDFFSRLNTKLSER